ncbi:alpha/beta fold hydrolase [Sphingomonas sp. PB4P5]|uniref:alpha/beta fold hydrolase n=1 Tax=Parasphingomonas puruogangriensis TaxID=3096155 RepID=UPI002FCA7430
MTIIAAISIVGTAGAAPPGDASSARKSTTIVLVHGAFAGSSSWNSVIAKLARDGYPVIAAANPLRGLKTDADYVARIVRDVRGRVLLVGHSYGGGVISMAAEGSDNVKGLVFVAGFAPEAGESAVSLGNQFPTGTLGQTLTPPIPQADGSKDVYIAQEKYWKQFAADVPAANAVQMAATQRPITVGALGEPAGPGAWKKLPSWFIWGSADRNIPHTLHAFMAKRAGAKEAVEVKGASHVVMISHPDEVAAMIERAAAAP